MGILPLVDSASKSDEKILIKCKTGEPEKASQKMYVLGYLYPLPNAMLGEKLLIYGSFIYRITLDLSSIKGGAPARTRGLNMYCAEDLIPNGSTDEKLS